MSISNGISRIDSGWVNEHVLVQLSPDITSNTLTANSIKLTGTQLPLTNTLDVTGSCYITGDCNITYTCGVYGLFTAFAGALINNDCTISSLLTVGTIAPPGSGDLILKGYGTTKIDLGNTVAITGNVSMPGYMFCAGYVSATGTKLASTGQVSYTVTRTSGFAAGCWTITFASAHPSGAYYITNLTGQGCTSYIGNGTYAPTSTKLIIVTFTNATTTLADYPFNFMVLAS